MFCVKCGAEIKDTSKVCEYCGIEIKTGVLKRCPNCKMILDPNNYIDWRYSFYGFLCLLCLIPLLITVLFIISQL